MTREEIYDRVNQCETLKELSSVIKDLADKNGDIQGRTKKFNANQMAKMCLDFKKHFYDLNANVLTREYGIRQQAMYIAYYN